MLRLRPFRISDAKYLIDWVKEERTFSMWCANKFEYPLTEQQIIDYKELYDIKEYGWSFTALNTEGVPVGHFLMRKVDYEKQSVHLAFVIVDEKYRDQGFGKEMVGLSVKYAFEMLKVMKVTLSVFDNNPSAQYCYKSVGFEEVKHYENIFPYKDEKWGYYDMQIESTLK